MTKDVLVSISGMHEEIVAVTPEVEDENEAIEVVTPATYYLKNGKHYIVYEVDFEEDKIAVQIDYELDVNHEPMADCKIRMNIVSKDSGKFSVLS